MFFLSPRLDPTIFFSYLSSLQNPRMFIDSRESFLRRWLLLNVSNEGGSAL